jgi:hypothetical protein
VTFSNAGTRLPNPVILAIDEGHFFKTLAVKGQTDEQVCRHDLEPWPCQRVREARRMNASQYLSLVTGKAKVA